MRCRLIMAGDMPQRVRSEGMIPFSRGDGFVFVEKNLFGKIIFTVDIPV